MNGFGMGFGMWTFWIVLIVVVVFLAKMIGSSSDQSSVTPESPHKILQKRYASGEIDKDEFEKMKKELDK